MTKFSATLLAGIAAAVIASGAAQADVVISKKPTANMSCSAGVCSPTAAKAVLNATDLTNMLAGGDVKVMTGSGATNIVVKDSFSWTSTSRLTLDAIQSVEFDKPVTVAGTGAVTITTNDGGTGGDLLFGDKGNLTFWDLSSSLIVNGNSYTLVGDIQTLAADIAANPSGFYALANDYDASVDGTYGSAPIKTALKGIFEGLGHMISDLKIVSSDDEVALFAEAFGMLRDIRLIEIYVQGTGSQGHVGTLLGDSELATIIGCSASGSVILGFGYGGGLVGGSGPSQDGTITRSHTSVSVSGGDRAYIGGLVGASGFSILFSYAIGSVKGGENANAGGLVGNQPIGTRAISQSYSAGKVSAGKNAIVGGLIGSVGGLVDVENSYAAGAVTADSDSIVGGLAGQIDGETKLQSSYSTGHVGGKTSGGFLGTYPSGETFFDYWDTETSGKSRHAGCGGGKCGRRVKGLTTEEFQSGLPEGFDPRIWGQKSTINNGYPYLLANPPPK